MKLDNITRGVNKSILKTKKNSPHIFFGLGIVGTLVSTALACRATMKLEDLLDEIHEEVDIIQTDCNHTDIEYVQMYRWALVHGAVNIGKLYGPAALVQILSIAALSGSHVQMTRRNSALMATLVAVHRGVENYRDKVIEEIGEEKEEEIHACVSLVDKSDWNAFTRIFDENSSNYHKDSEINRNFLHFVQSRANEMLRTRGIVFLNDVYDMLGFEQTRLGHIYGWVYGGDGLNEIDFGIFEAANSRFINGLERAVVLNFNVDGPLHEYI